jgi:hypothetical protein
MVTEHVSSFCVAVTKILDINKRKDFFGSKFQKVQSMVVEAYGGKGSSLHHMVDKKQRGKVSTELAFFLFLFHFTRRWGSLWDGAAYIQGGSYPPPRNTLINTLKVSFTNLLGASISNQVNNEN